MLLNKGFKVENKLFSSAKFLGVFILLGVISNLLYVMFQYALYHYGEGLGVNHAQIARSYRNDCVLGLSTLLFALNIVTTHLARAGPVGQLFVWGEMLFSSFVVLRRPNLSHYRSFCLDNSGLLAAYIFLLFLNRFFETKMSHTKTPFHLTFVEIGFGLTIMVGLYYTFVQHIVPASILPQTELYAAILILIYIVIQLVRTWAEGREVKQNVIEPGAPHKTAIVDSLADNLAKRTEVKKAK